MSKDQSHGNYLEDLYKLYVYPNCPTINHQSKWDIPAEYNNIDNLPISVKATAKPEVHFADARTFWTIAVNFKLVVFTYNQQNGCEKEITSIK